MKFMVSWLWERGEDPENPQTLIKNPDTDNRNMYITDNLGIKINHMKVGGAAAEKIKLTSGEKVYGWFLFPKPAERAYEFAFHDDDQQMVVEGIRLQK